MIASLNNIILGVSAMLALVHAVPDVVVYPVGRGCSAFTNEYTFTLPIVHYLIADTMLSRAGPFRFIIDQADDPAINGLRATSRSYTRIDGSRVNTLVFDLRKSLSFAKPLYNCVDGVLKEWSGDAASIYISTAPDTEGELVYGNDGIKLTTYEHVYDGQQQQGIFYGANNSTRWAFKYLQPAERGGPIDFYLARLLKKDEKASLGEIEGFLTGELP